MISLEIKISSIDNPNLASSCCRPTISGYPNGRHETRRRSTSGSSTPIQRDGRITKLALAEKVGLSPTPCWMRLRKLEKAGIVSGYHARIDLRSVAPVATVLMEVTLRQPPPGRFRPLRAGGARHAGDRRLLVGRRRRRLSAEGHGARHRRLSAPGRRPARARDRHRPLLHLHRHQDGEGGGRGAAGRRCCRRRRPDSPDVLLQPPKWRDSLLPAGPNSLFLRPRRSSFAASARTGGRSDDRAFRPPAHVTMHSTGSPTAGCCASSPMSTAAGPPAARARRFEVDRPRHRRQSSPGSQRSMPARPTAAIDAAARAFPKWRALLPQERATILRSWYDLMLAAKRGSGADHDAGAGQAAGGVARRDRLRRLLRRVVCRGSQAARTPRASPAICPTPR